MGEAADSDVGTRFLARVIADGRVTIPETVRALLRVKDGDMVELTLVGWVRGRGR